MTTNGRVSAQFINRLYAFLEDYESEVHASLLTVSSQTDYIAFAEQFVRWIEGDFHPGKTLEDYERENV